MFSQRENRGNSTVFPLRKRKKITFCAKNASLQLWGILQESSAFGFADSREKEGEKQRCFLWKIVASRAFALLGMRGPPVFLVFGELKKLLFFDITPEETPLCFHLENV